MEVVELLATPVLVALFAALFSYVGSTRGYVRQRWWERRADAYDRLLEAVWHLYEYDDLHYDEYIERSSQIPDEMMDVLNNQWMEARRSIKRAESLGAYLLSEEAVETLRQLWKDRSDVKDPEDFYEIVEANWSASHQCMKRLTECAKRDLKIAPEWYRFWEH